VNIVNKYIEYRKIEQTFVQGIIDANIKRSDIYKAGRMLGLVDGNTVVMNNGYDTSCVLDFLINEYNGEVETILQKHLIKNRNNLSIVEKEVLKAYANSYSSFFQATSSSAEKCSIELLDLFNNDNKVVLTDIAISKITLQTRILKTLIFTRIVPFTEFNMTSGIVFAFDIRNERLLASEYDKIYEKLSTGDESMKRFICFFKLNKKFCITTKKIEHT